MDSVGKIHACIYTFLGVYVQNVLLTVLYLNFSKALNHVSNDNFANKTEIYSTVKAVIICICKLWIYFFNDNVNYVS